MPRGIPSDAVDDAPSEDTRPDGRRRDDDLPQGREAVAELHRLVCVQPGQKFGRDVLDQRRHTFGDAFHDSHHGRRCAGELLSAESAAR